MIGHLRGAGQIASGPRSPTPGAPYTYVTTKEFLLEFGLDTLRDLPNSEALEDAGLLSRKSCWRAIFSQDWSVKRVRQKLKSMRAKTNCLCRQDRRIFAIDSTANIERRALQSAKKTRHL